VDKKRFVVLGKTLAPLTLYHCRILELMGSRFFVQSESEPEYTELFQFIFICQFAERESIDELLGGQYEQAINELVMDIDIEDIDWQEEFDIASEYMKYYMERPLRKASKENESPRAPWWGSAKSFLCDHCGYTNTEAWDCIVCEAYSEMAFFSSRMDDDALIAEQTIKVIEQMKSGELVVPTQDELKKRMAGIK